jgi:hypothetical protein
MVEKKKFSLKTVSIRLRKKIYVVNTDPLGKEGQHGWQFFMIIFGNGILFF